MRWHEPLDDILNSKVKVKILRLLSRTRTFFTGREVSRLVGFSPTHTISALRELEVNGLVSRRRAGSSDLYSLNTKNIMVDKALIPLFSWEQTLFDELVELFKQVFVEDLLCIILFGSVALGEESFNSDIDLLLVLKDGTDITLAEEEIAEVSLGAAIRFGNPISPIIVTENDFNIKVKSAKGFWKEIPKKSITIYSRGVEKE